MRVLGCCSLQKILCLAICTLADYDYLIVGSVLLTQDGFISDPRTANKTTTAPAIIVVVLMIIIFFFS